MIALIFGLGLLIGWATRKILEQARRRQRTVGDLEI